MSGFPGGFGFPSFELWLILREEMKKLPTGKVEWDKEFKTLYGGRKWGRMFWRGLRVFLATKIINTWNRYIK